MKKLFFILFFSFLMGSNSYSQNGIKFMSGSWQEMLDLAKRENKLIFLDAYAEWCGPCKIMTRDVFPDESVGDYFNPRFVNVKMDMEKGEGIELASKLGIMAYPSLLFIDGRGETVHRAIGYHSSDMLIGLGETAIDPSKNIGGLKARYKNGERSPEFLYGYVLAAYSAMDLTYVEIAHEYLSTQSDWSTSTNMELIIMMTQDIDSKMFKYILDNRSNFDKEFGEKAVSGKIEELIQKKIAYAETEQDLSGIENLYRQLHPKNAEQMIQKFKMGFYAQKEDWKSFSSLANSYFKNYRSQNWEELNEIAWIFYEEVEGEKELKSALSWAKQSVKLESNYFNNDTVASLYFKLGKKGKALKAAKKAIEIAQREGEDYSSTEYLIEQIKGM